MPVKIVRLLIISLLLTLFLISGSSFQPQPIAHAVRAPKEHMQVTPIGHPLVQLKNMDIHAMATISTSNVWIAGDYTNVANQPQTFFEHFDGQYWAVIASPSIGGTSSSIEGISAISANDIWAVGSYQDRQSHAFTEHWDGTQWSRLDPPNPSDFSHDSHLHAVIVLSTNDVWAVGGYYPKTPYGNEIALIEHWNGSQWQPVNEYPNIVSGQDPFLLDRHLTTLTANSPTDIWAIGSLGGSSFRNVVPFSEHYDGVQWSIIPILNINSGYGDSTYLPSISAIDTNNVWTVGSFSGSDESGLISEHWNGSQWFFVSFQNLPGTNQILSSVVALQTNNVWAMGTFFNGYHFHPLVMHWNGSFWSAVSLPLQLHTLDIWQRLGDTNTLISIGTYQGEMRLLTLTEE